MKHIASTHIRTAFTLIELLIVIAVVGVLAALLFPVFSRAKAQAGSTTCLSNLHQVGQAIGLYAGDYDDYLPYARNCTGPPTTNVRTSDEPPGSTVQTPPDIKTVLAAYQAIDALFHCPIDRRTIDVIYPNAPLNWYGTVGSSYQFNDWDALHVTSLSAYKNPACSFLMGDMEAFHNQSEDGSGFTNVLHMDLHVKALTGEQRQEALDNTVEEQQ